MASARHDFLLAILTVSAWGQIAGPAISREGILPRTGQQWLEPGQFVAIYGQRLAKPGGCFEKLESKAGDYPTDACETHVTVNGIRAGLQFIGERQINIKLPVGIPSAGRVAIAVIVRGVSSQAITVPIGKPKLTLSVVGRAYVHMPVWIAHNVPVPYSDPLRHPIGLSGGRFEASRNGVLLKPLQIPLPSGGIAGSLGGVPTTAAPLPLHLQYRFNQPGKYEIRYIGTRTQPDLPHTMHTVVVERSDWTTIEIEPFSDAKRTDWIRERAQQMPSSGEQLIGKALPELLAVPDGSVLSVILPLLYHSDESVRRYVVASLALFDSAVVAKRLTPIVRERGPTVEIARLLDQKENLLEGGHETLLRMLPGFLNSPSAQAQAGALQFIVWEPNHEWGKGVSFQSQRSALVMNAAPGMLEHGNPQLHQLLALALGSIRTEPSRDLLWRMINEGKAAEQSMIALTWIGDARDLPRLAKSTSFSANALHQGYGSAALPWLKKVARDTNQLTLRLACARELVIAGEPEGFQYLAQALDDSPSFASEIVQFVQGRFPELRGADQSKVLDFLRLRATASR